MRDSNRIYDFCNQLVSLWVAYCPDLRFGQFISLVFEQIQEKYDRDPFFIEETEMLGYIKEFLGVDKS